MRAASAGCSSWTWVVEAVSADPTSPSPAGDLDDPRTLQILTTEHWSLLSARSLAYNEAFTRGGMFLTFLSMSLVGLALFSSAIAFDDTFLAIAAIVLAFDLIVGIATYARIIGANLDDLRAVHGMARIRHGYTQIAPIVTPYFTTGTHDDTVGVNVSYGSPAPTGVGAVLYWLTTSGCMISLIVSLIGGVLTGLVALMLGGSGGAAMAVGLGTTLIGVTALTVATFAVLRRRQAALQSMFPTPPESITGD
jgi:hypothetical protein